MKWLAFALVIILLLLVLFYDVYWDLLLLGLGFVGAVWYFWPRGCGTVAGGEEENAEGPKVIRDGKVYSVRELWKLIKKAPTVQLRSLDLEWNLYEMLWDDENGKAIRPMDVVNNPNVSPMHVSAIRKANLKYPIIVRKVGSRYDILDGLHRLCRAIAEGKSNLKAKVVTEDMLEKAYLREWSS